MTTTVTKIDTKWETKRTQEVTSEIISSMHVAAAQVLEKLGEKPYEEYMSILREHKLNLYKQMGVKTPMDLVRAIAEIDFNLYGSQIEITGDEKRANLTYKTCGVWESMQKMCKFTAEQEEKMGKYCTANWTAVAKEFGFTYEPKMEKDSYGLTFSK